MPLSLPPLSFFPSFLLFIFTFPAFFLIVRANRRCLYAPQAKLSMLLLPRACLPILFFFSSRCALLVPCPSLAPSRTSFSFLENLRSVFARARSQLPSIGFSPFRLLLIAFAATPLTNVTGRADSLLARPLTSHDSGNLAFALFFGYDGFLRSMRVDFFLISTRARVHPPCIKVSFQSSGFFCRDNVPGYFRVYLSILSPSPPFYCSIFSYTFLHVISLCTLYILVLFHASPRVFLE